jgi:hypothetical protein
MYRQKRMSVDEGEMPADGTNAARFPPRGFRHIPLQGQLIKVRSKDS